MEHSNNREVDPGAFPWMDRPKFPESAKQPETTEAKPAHTTPPQTVHKFKVLQFRREETPEETPKTTPEETGKETSDTMRADNRQVFRENMGETALAESIPAGENRRPENENPHSDKPVRGLHETAGVSPASGYVTSALPAEEISRAAVGILPENIKSELIKPSSIALIALIVAVSAMFVSFNLKINKNLEEVESLHRKSMALSDSLAATGEQLRENDRRLEEHSTRIGAVEEAIVSEEQARLAASLADSAVSLRELAEHAKGGELSARLEETSMRIDLISSALSGESAAPGKTGSAK